MKTFKKAPVQAEPKVVDKIQEEFGDKIKKEVMSHLKNVKNIYKVRVKHLWDHRWRVNIWCQHDSQTELSILPIISIDYSYFVRTNSDGEIINSDPQLGARFGE
jgi:hypothetical protein|tara:strand:- start:1516 stop:1827 length:312 start_codon:yes stop_codon:yes gene_type:complete